MISKDTFFSKKQTINFNGRLIDLSSPLVMGILNLSDDSFYAGSRYSGESEIIRRCEEILSEGGTIIDVGACSSRPGAHQISKEEELVRLTAGLEVIRKKFPDVLVSVDTFRSVVARTVVETYGVHMINDISAGQMDDAMLATIGSLKVPYIAMHMKGTMETMHQQTSYNHIVRDIISYFSKVIEQSRQNNIMDIIIDPGFGFSKTVEQNYELLAHLDSFRIFEVPILVGLSRKSMIYKLLAQTPEDALPGTITVNTLALLKGASILRVHDVKEAMASIKILKAYQTDYTQY